jgi:hypothetical protein
VIRDIRRKTRGNEDLREPFVRTLSLAERVLAQDRHPRGSQFVAHLAALPRNPYDGHTLATIIPAMQAIIGNTLDRIIATPDTVATTHRPKISSRSHRRPEAPHQPADQTRHEKAHNR